MWMLIRYGRVCTRDVFPKAIFEDVLTVGRFHRIVVNDIRSGQGYSREVRPFRILIFVAGCNF